MDVFMEYTRTPIVVYYDDKLPEAGLYGNTHFPMPDLNNAEVAQLMYGWLRGKKAGLRTPKAETRKSTQAKKEPPGQFLPMRRGLVRTDMLGKEGNVTSVLASSPRWLPRSRRNASRSGCVPAHRANVASARWGRTKSCPSPG